MPLNDQIASLVANTGQLIESIGVSKDKLDNAANIAETTLSEHEASENPHGQYVEKVEGLSPVLFGDDAVLRTTSGDPLVIDEMSLKNSQSYVDGFSNSEDKITNEKEASHFLRQAAIGGGTLNEIQRVVQLGSRRAWLLEQIHTPESARPFPAWTGANENVPAAGYIGTIARRLAPPRNPTAGTFPQFAFNSPRFTYRILLTSFLGNASTSPTARNDFLAPDETFRLKATWVLSKFIPCSVPGGGWDSYDKSMQIAGWYAMLARYAFKNYADLLEEVTYSPAMARMLTYYANQKQTGDRHPDENYAREIMQLFTLGLWELNLDGTRKLDSEGKPIYTYNQEDIRQMARVFTGLSRFDQPDTFYTNPGNASSASGSTTMTAEANSFYDGISGTYQTKAPGVMPRLRHFIPFYETGSKIALDGRINIPADTNPVTNIRMAIDGLVNHPSCAPFVCKNLIKHMVTSNPSPGYVARVASVFRNDGTGQVGNLAAVWEAILCDKEASHTVYTNPTHGRVMDGFEIYAKNVRTLSREATHASALDSSTDTASNASVWIDQVYQPGPVTGFINEQDAIFSDFGAWPVQSPSIFGFNSPDFTITPASTWNLAIPEVGSTGPSTMMRLLSNTLDRINHREPTDTTGDLNNLCKDYSLFFPVSGTAREVINRVNILFCGGALPEQRMERMTTILSQMPITTETERNNRISVAIQMAAYSTEYWVM